MLPVVFGVALVVRLLHVRALQSSPLFDVLLGDGRAYDAWAQRLAAGDWIGTDVFYQAPLYPYLLGLVYATVGHDLLAVRLLQATLGAAGATLLAAAARQLVSPRVGWLAGLALGLYAPAVFFDGLIQKSSLDTFLTCLLIWVSSRLIDHPERRSAWVALGAVLGALSLTRENALALVAVAIAWALTRRVAIPSGSGRWMPAAALLIGLGVTLAPVALRNYAVTGGFYLTTSQFGPNFYIGNNPTADGTYRGLRPGREWPEFERQDATALAERARGRPLSPAEVSAYWTERALAFIASEPGRWLRLQARKVALLWNRSEMLDTESQESYEAVSPILRLLGVAGHFGVLVPLALVGLVAVWPDRRRWWPLLAFPAAYAASVVVFYVFARYRFPLVPFLVLLAAAGARAARQLWTGAGPRPRAAAAAVLALVTIAVNRPMLSAARMRAISETNIGTALHEAGRPADAVARYQTAIALQPDYVPAYNNLGVSLRAMGRTDEAIAAYERGLAAGARDGELRFNLGNALLAAGRAVEAEGHLRAALDAGPGDAGVHNNLGMALAAQGRAEEAALQFRAALAADPASVLAHRNLGNALAALGRPGEARAAFERAVALDPQDADAAYDLGTLLLETHQYADAVRWFEAALAVAPRSARALNNLGIALGSQGRLGEAMVRFEQALAVDPTFAEARRNLETARAAGGPAGRDRPGR